jgi:LPS O-antigen subunit length determinant protein (WzzB/FepE family)
MSNKPQIKIKGKIQDMNKKQKNVKPKHSNFLLTINTNQQYKDDDEHLNDDIKIFENTIQDILNKIDEYINLPQGDIWNDETIKDCDIDYTIERGTKKG